MPAVDTTRHVPAGLPAPAPAPAPVPASLRLASVSFTGKLASMTRQEATGIVQRAGGRVTSGLSRRTTMLVIGVEGWPLLSDGSPTGKLRRAEELNRAGARIAIVAEGAFLECAGLRERRPALRKSFPPAQVCTLLGLELAALRRWEAIGLVQAHDGRFDFQDIVSLRTITELLRGGVAASTIARSVERLASVLPGTERPLAQLKLVAESGTLLAELGDAMLAPDGQFVIDFDRRATGTDDDGAPPGAVIPLTGAPGTRREERTADAWFDQGVTCEEQDAFEEAIEAYRRALALQATFPEAHFNLGNALRAAERPAAAEEHFRMAVAQDPAMAPAWYNLADVLEEQGHLPDAIASLRAAIGIDPTYADAHYNLALCCEAHGDLAAARRHWRSYLKLDPAGDWAQTARSHLAALPAG